MEKNSLKLSFVGDIFPANLGYNSGFGVASSFSDHNGTIWNDQLYDLIGNSDVVFGNLESPLLKDEEYCKNNTFAGHGRFSNFLKKHKIEIVSIANNHILEQGIEGFNSTCKILEENKIKFVGRNEDSLSNIEIIEKNGIRIGFCGFNAIHDISNPNAYAELYEQNLFDTIEKLNNINLDYRVISLHWGNEYIHYPSKKQIELAHKIIDSNIDIIVGHHPHVVQPVEEYKNGVIFYSLGNFLFDMLWSEKVKHGIIAEINFTKTNFKFKTKSIKLMNNYGPTYYLEGSKKVNKINIKHSEKLITFKKYINRYGLKAKLNRFYERILMKKEIVKNWHKINKENKTKFLNKLIGKLIEK